MQNTEIPAAEGWNIFAVELQRILAKHHATIRSLEPTVNPAIVQRLVESLNYQGLFPVLTPDPLHLVVKKYCLTAEERRHLLATIIVTSIQQKLTKRLDNARKARLAAYAILNIIEDALIDASEGAGPLAEIANDLRGESTRMMQVSLQSAINSIDCGILALYTVEHMDEANSERTVTAREAYNHFMEALSVLEETMQDNMSDSDCLYWAAEAKRGQRRAADYGGYSANY